MKRLFQVRDTKSGATLERMFPQKTLAKLYRNELGGPPQFVVTPGPDHRNYEGGTVSDRTNKAGHA